MYQERNKPNNRKYEYMSPARWEHLCNQKIERRRIYIFFMVLSIILKQPYLWWLLITFLYWMANRFDMEKIEQWKQDGSLDDEMIQEYRRI